MNSSSVQRRIGFWAVVCLLLALTKNLAWSADRYLIAPVTLENSVSIPSKVADALNSQGWMLYTQSYGVREEICEIFLAKTLPQAGAGSASGKTSYGKIEKGSFVGIIHLLPEATEDYSADFHNQALRPGYYSLRYAVMPAGTYENGTKMGDFVVLSQLSMDPDPNRVLSEAELNRFGAATSGSDVAASMELMPPAASAHGAADIKVDETDLCIFQVQVQLRAGKTRSSEKLTLAIGLFTPIHEAEGS